jgi:hypothetical protein
MVHLYIALLHYPVCNKEGRVVTTSVTNMDIHDISRTARTYGVKRFYIVTPIVKQRELVEKILDHWRKGYGASYNPLRKEAFEIVDVKESLEAVMEDVSVREEGKTRVVVTRAGSGGMRLRFDEFRERLKGGNDSYLIVFGTGWGIAEEVVARADFLLESVRGPGAYNHLPVRAAVAVVLDRLAGTH